MISVRHCIGNYHSKQANSFQTTMNNNSTMTAVYAAYFTSSGNAVTGCGIRRSNSSSIAATFYPIQAFHSMECSIIVWDSVVQ